MCACHQETLHHVLSSILYMICILALMCAMHAIFYVLVVKVDGSAFVECM